MDAASLQDVRSTPPNRETQGIRDMILPQPFQRKPRVTEHPAVNHQESQDRANLGREQSGERVWPRKKAGHNLDQDQANAAKDTANSAPPHYLR